jgi:hypothetical protein
MLQHRKANCIDREMARPSCRCLIQRRARRVTRMFNSENTSLFVERDVSAVSARLHLTYPQPVMHEDRRVMFSLSYSSLCISLLHPDDQHLIRPVFNRKAVGCKCICCTIPMPWSLLSLSLKSWEFGKVSTCLARRHIRVRLQHPRLGLPSPTRYS